MSNVLGKDPHNLLICHSIEYIVQIQDFQKEEANVDFSIVDFGLRITIFNNSFFKEGRVPSSHLKSGSCVRFSNSSSFLLFFLISLFDGFQ